MQREDVQYLQTAVYPVLREFSRTKKKNITKENLVGDITEIVALSCKRVKDVCTLN